MIKTVITKLVLGFGLVTLICCKVAYQRKSSVRAIQFSSNFPFVDSINGKFILTNLFADDDIMIFYKDFVICSYKIISTDKNGDEDTTKNNREYFIFKKTNENGYLYDSSMKKNIGKSLVDSMLMKKFFYKGHFEAIKNDSLIFTYKERNGYFVAKYVPKTKYDISFPDTSIYLFSQTFHDGGYPLSAYMDSLWKSKLVSVRFIYNQSKYVSTKATIPYREFAIEKKEIKLENESRIMEFVERFKIDYNY